MNNHDYNVINQLIQEQKSLWRIERLYIEEAKSDEERALWERIRDDKRIHVAELKNLAQSCLE